MAEDVNLEQMLDLATPWCLRMAATLRLPELIAAGHRDIGELAARGTDSAPGGRSPGMPTSRSEVTR